MSGELREKKKVTCLANVNWCILSEQNPIPAKFRSDESIHLKYKGIPSNIYLQLFFSNFVAKLIVFGFTCALRSCSPIRFLNAIVCQEKRTISTDYQSTDNSFKVIFYIDTYHDHSNFCTVRSLLEGFRDVRISRLLMQQQIHRALALLVSLIKPNEVQRSINCFANV